MHFPCRSDYKYQNRNYCFLPVSGKGWLRTLTETLHAPYLNGKLIDNMINSQSFLWPFSSLIITTDNNSSKFQSILSYRRNSSTSTIYNYTDTFCKEKERFEFDP